METKYFKRHRAPLTWFSSIKEDNSGIEIMLDNEGKMAKVEKCMRQPLMPNSVECSEEEFNEACEKAMEIIVGVLPVAA